MSLLTHLDKKPTPGQKTDLEETEEVKQVVEKKETREVKQAEAPVAEVSNSNTLQVSF